METLFDLQKAASEWDLRGEDRARADAAITLQSVGGFDGQRINECEARRFLKAAVIVATAAGLSLKRVAGGLDASMLKKKEKQDERRD